MDSKDFWCKIKLRSCLFFFCVLFTTFLCWKPAKQSREVWNHVFFAASFEKNTNGPNWLRSLPWSIRLELYSINRHIQPRTNFSCFYSQKVVTHQFLAELEPSSGMRFVILCTVTLILEQHCSGAIRFLSQHRNHQIT